MRTVHSYVLAVLPVVLLAGLSFGGLVPHLLNTPAQWISHRASGAAKMACGWLRGSIRWCHQRDLLSVRGQCLSVDCKYLDGVNCQIGFHGGRPSDGVCRVCISRGTNHPERLGTLLKTKIDHFLSQIHFYLPIRSRYHLGMIDRIRGCGGCGGRARWIDKNIPWPRVTVE